MKKITVVMSAAHAADLSEEGGGEVGDGTDVPVSEGGREGPEGEGSGIRRAPQGY